jgi:hypothetical protein
MGCAGGMCVATLSPRPQHRTETVEEALLEASVGISDGVIETEHALLVEIQSQGHDLDLHAFISPLVNCDEPLHCSV